MPSDVVQSSKITKTYAKSLCQDWNVPGKCSTDKEKPKAAGDKEANTIHALYISPPRGQRCCSVINDDVYLCHNKSLSKLKCGLKCPGKALHKQRGTKAADGDKEDDLIASWLIHSSVLLWLVGRETRVVSWSHGQLVLVLVGQVFGDHYYTIQGRVRKGGLFRIGHQISVLEVAYCLVEISHQSFINCSELCSEVSVRYYCASKFTTRAFQELYDVYFFIHLQYFIFL